MALLCGAAAAKGGKRTQPSHIPETSVWRSCVDRENAATLSALPSRDLLCVLLFSSKPEERPPSLTPHGPRPVLSVVFQPQFVAPRRQLRSVQPCATIRRFIVIGLRKGTFTCTKPLTLVSLPGGAPSEGHQEAAPAAEQESDEHSGKHRSCARLCTFGHTANTISHIYMQTSRQILHLHKHHDKSYIYMQTSRHISHLHANVATNKLCTQTLTRSHALCTQTLTRSHALYPNTRTFSHDLHSLCGVSHPLGCGFCVQ
jgi:hypothetical protein